jgi:hypothetical protein
MKTGCEKCDEKQREAGDDYALCDECEVAYLKYCWRKAKDDYYKKLEQILNKEKRDETNGL